MWKVEKRLIRRVTAGRDFALHHLNIPPDIAELLVNDLDNMNVNISIMKNDITGHKVITLSALDELNDTINALNRSE